MSISIRMSNNWNIIRGICDRIKNAHKIKLLRGPQHVFVVHLTAYAPLYSYYSEWFVNKAIKLQTHSLVLYSSSRSCILPCVLFPWIISYRIQCALPFVVTLAACFRHIRNQCVYFLLFIWLRNRFLSKNYHCSYKFNQLISAKQSHFHYKPYDMEGWEWKHLKSCTF